MNQWIVINYYKEMKMNIKINLMIGTFIMMMLVSSSVLAGSGKAIVPLWGSGNGDFSTVIDVSNITDNPINVSFTFYGSAGNVIASTYISYYNISSTGELSSKNTGSVVISGLPSNDYGFAVITWENKTGNDVVGLVSQGLRIYTDSSVRSEYAILINQGMPF